MVFGRADTGSSSHSRFNFDGVLRRIVNRDRDRGGGKTRLPELKECPGDDVWYSDDHRIPLKRLLDRYDSSLIKGLMPHQVTRNQYKYGSNTFTPKVKSSEFKKILKSFIFGLNSLIWLCAVLSLTSYGIERWFDPHYTGAELLFGVTLILATVLSGLSFYYQEYKSLRIMESFKELMSPQYAMVKRDGHFKEIYVEELVVGDLVKLTYGDVIPADIRLIECQEFYVDNSSLTGESDPSRRTSSCTDIDPMETKNLVFFSTHAVEGHAKGIVVAVGTNTVMGRMAELAGSLGGEGIKKGTTAAVISPIAQEIQRFIKYLSIRSLGVGVAFFLLAVCLKTSWQEGIAIFNEIIVASVPEGLNLTCTILLVLMAKRMGKKNCLVKNLHALETLGATSVICTDKTGTLTQNRMSIAHLWFNGRFVEADTSEFVDVTGGDKDKSFDKVDPAFKALGRVARLCSRAKFKQFQADYPIFRREVHGDASEAAILRFMEAQTGNVRKYRAHFKRVCEIPFNSRTKYQTYVHEMKEGGQSLHLVTIKGAPEKVANLCNRILIGNTEYSLDEHWKNKLHRALCKLGSFGERVIGFADGYLPPEKYNKEYIYSAEKPEFLNIGLRFVGLMSMIDPPRAAVPSAIHKIRAAGVRVVMITGDHPSTALAVGRAVGIVSPAPQAKGKKSPNPDLISRENDTTIVEIDPCPKPQVVTGSELKHMDEVQLQELISSSNEEMIFSRTTPEQKYLIVEAFQKLGHFVTVVGDGVNDSSAMKKADIGLSMGISGTDVSKAISDLVLLDDNFMSVVTAVEEGRRGFENLKKILVYSLADNVAEMYSFLFCILLQIPLPLGTMAILLTVLGTDVLPAVSLMFEQPETELMKMKPRNTTKERLISRQLLVHVYAHVAFVEAFAGFFAYFTAMASYGFMPLTLLGIRAKWQSRNVNDLVDSWGQEWTYCARKELETHAQTAFFVSIVLMQIGNVIICKTRRQSIFQKNMTNWWMNLSLVVAVGMTCAIIYIRPLAWFFGMKPLRPQEWAYTLPFVLLLIVLDEVRRFYLRKFSNGTIYGILEF